MDSAPSVVAKSVTKTRRSRHGSVRSRRPPSPDSACEGDPPSGGGTPLASDMSEESDKGHTPQGHSTLVRRKSENFFAKGLPGQDSDVDSGIVTCRKPGERIGSTSSADTDSSQESRRRIEYSPPVQKAELTKSRSSAGSLRLPRRSLPSSGPVKGDHSALKECNGRPPTPLSIFPDSHHCVRFDEQLPLSEQNIRRSCRKLFATLYAQRFSYPAHASYNSSVRSSQSRNRSRTAPELDLRRLGPAAGDSRYGRSFKDKSGDGRSGSVRSIHKSSSEVELAEKVLSAHVQDFTIHVHPRLSLNTIDHGTPHSTSTDSGLGSLRNSTQCTCHVSLSSSFAASSPPGNPSAQCKCCSCGLSQPSFDNSPKLFKSNSCTTLAGSLPHQSRPQLTQFPPRTMRKMVAQVDDKPKLHIQKTSSCSNLLEKTANGYQVANIPVNNSNMIQVYAHIASVIPEDLKTTPESQGGRRAKTLHRMRYNTDSSFDVIRPFPLTTTTFFNPESTRSRSSKSVSQNSNEQLPADRTSKTLDMVSCNSNAVTLPSMNIYSQIADNASDTFKRNPHRSSLQRACENQLPKNVGVVVPNPVYLKSALKKPTQSAIIHGTMESQILVKNEESVIHPSEVEYAVVDKSKKNRFATSLPSLNGSLKPIEISHVEEPPVPPKKHLHKSEASLNRSRSSSPKKSLLWRMQSALAKAFSTERIYRPEREERREGSLQRSRSFIRGLAGSLRRKKKKPQPVAPQLPLQRDSPSPEWEEEAAAGGSQHVRGQLLQLNLDGSQVVELIKPASRPYGFFVARGRVRNSKGVFVSRMRDAETQKQLAGLLDIGDEILEIDGIHVKEADIMEVNRLMANKNTLLLTVLPYICRKDI